VVKSHDDLAVAIRRNSSNIGPRNLPKSAGGLPMEAWQRDIVQVSVVIGMKVDMVTHCVFISSRDNENAN